MKIYSIVYKTDLFTEVYTALIRLWVENIQEIDKDLYLDDSTLTEPIALTRRLLRKRLKEVNIVKIYRGKEFIFKIEKHEISRP